ncbi:MAG: phenylalanine--tRNA ligase subunit alpha, partial [Candidatus Omnitrophica bacterium]|nr:phenylalanine--tRNA ligase subunit alpha [Candidatus Omnitrophota bacterium]
MREELNKISEKAFAQIRKASTLAELEETRVQFLGRKSELIQFLRNIGSLPAKERAEAGSEANEVKRQLEAEYDNRRLELERRASILPKDFDISLPGIKPELGHLHPLTQTVQDITDIFERLNFEVV